MAQKMWPQLLSAEILFCGHFCITYAGTHTSTYAKWCHALPVFLPSVQSANCARAARVSLPAWKG